MKGTRSMRMRFTRLQRAGLGPAATLFAALGLLFPARLAQAQTRSDSRVSGGNGDGMDSHLFRPAIDSKGFFSVNGSGILGAGNISFALVLDYRRNLIRPTNGGPPQDAPRQDCAAFKSRTGRPGAARPRST